MRFNSFLKTLLISASVIAAPSYVVAQTPMTVSKDASCGCCGSWVEHMGKSEFKVKTVNLGPTELADYKTELSIPKALRSCHTAEVGGYTIEGHVPAADVDRLLDEAPDSIGLVVPGMPMGSPGMDFGSSSVAYDVLLLKADGTTEVFTSYAAK